MRLINEHLHITNNKNEIKNKQLTLSEGVMTLKKSKGNMYPWITHMHNHLAGKCPHECSYCYVQKMRCGDRYRGDLIMDGDEIKINYGKDKIIFIEHMNDLFAEEIPDSLIKRIFTHCKEYPDNKYVFQTKNPDRAFTFLYQFPKNFMIGTTIETNRDLWSISKAPHPRDRYNGIMKFKQYEVEIFVTIEPIIDFDMNLAVWITHIKPKFVNIGADSKGCNLPEPSKEKILELIRILESNNINIKKKTNLERLLI